MRRTAAILLTALLVVTAGCGGSIGGDGGDGAGERTGTVNFYVSDQQNAIGDFAHLNVTVTRVGLHRTTQAQNGTGNATGNASGEWIEHDVDNVTVDLTELQGANATRLGALESPNGTYNKVFVYVDGIDATLENGESASVKLPSQKLRLNEQFTLGADEEVDFVYDLTVQETGNGRYVLKPVASQSGTDVPIEEKPSAKAGQGKRGGAGNGAGQNRTPKQGKVRLYVSDQPNAIDDFEHLNVTIMKVGFQRDDDEAGDASGEQVDESDDETANETESDDETANETESDDEKADETETEKSDDADDADESDDDGRAGWVERDVDAATVDLTELRGANATRIGDLDVPAGRYNKVFVYVSEIDATLADGERVTVKLPSEKLQLQKGFTVGDGEDVSFVYDIAVHEAGKSGKYVLRPVVGQSGTSDEVEIREREEPEDDDHEDDEDHGEGEDHERAGALNATFTTNVTAGENATLRVTRNGSAVANATVEVNGEAVGQTGADGTLTVAVPDDAEELEVKVTSGDLETELERDLSSGGDEGGETESDEANETGGNETDGGETDDEAAQSYSGVALEA